MSVELHLVPEAKKYFELVELYQLFQIPSQGKIYLKISPDIAQTINHRRSLSQQLQPTEIVVVLVPNQEVF